MSLIILTATFVLIVAALALAYRAQTPSRRYLAYGSSAIVALAAVFVIWTQRTETQLPGNPLSRGLSAGYMNFSGGPATTSTTAMRSDAQRLPSVPAMISQLEERLDAEPADAKGWSLLAKSYAYVGDTNGAETAISKAVSLGMEESALRAQVAAVGSSR